MKKLFSAAIAAGLALATAAHAAMVITVTEVDGDVVMKGIGRVVDENRTDYNGKGDFNLAFSDVTSSYDYHYAIGMGPYDYMSITPSVFGGGAVTSGAGEVGFEKSGDDYGHETVDYDDTSIADSTTIFIDEDYKSGDDIKFMWTFRDQTVGTLGTVFGMAFETNKNSLKIVDGRGLDDAWAVPVPGALPLFLSMIGAGAAWRRKQR